MNHKCPKCGSACLQVVVEVWAYLHQIGFNLETVIDDRDDHDWDSDSIMRCRECGYVSESVRFHEKLEQEV